VPLFTVKMAVDVYPEMLDNILPECMASYPKNQCGMLHVASPLHRPLVVDVCSANRTQHNTYRVYQEGFAICRVSEYLLY